MRIITDALKKQQIKITDKLSIQQASIPNDALLEFIKNYFVGYILECSFDADEEFVLGLLKLPLINYIEDLTIGAGSQENPSFTEATALTLTQSFRGYELAFPSLTIQKAGWHKILFDHPTLAYIYFKDFQNKLAPEQVCDSDIHRARKLGKYKGLRINIFYFYDALIDENTELAEEHYSDAEEEKVMISGKNAARIENLLRIMYARLTFAKFLHGNTNIDAEKTIALLLEIQHKSPNILAILETLSIQILETPLASHKDEDVSIVIKQLSETDLRRYQLGIIGLLHLGPRNSDPSLLAHRLLLLAENKLVVMQHKEAEDYLADLNNYKVVSLLQALYKIEIQLIGDKVSVPMPDNPTESVYTYYQSLHHPICMLQIQTQEITKLKKEVDDLKVLLNLRKQDKDDEKEDQGSSSSHTVFGHS